MKKLIVIFLIIIGGGAFGQTIYEGKSTIILDNKKDIHHLSNSNYKKKLIYEATINCIKQSSPQLINLEEFSFEDFDQADDGSQPTDRIVVYSKSGKSVQFQQVGEPIFRSSLRGDGRWECTIKGYVKEISDYVPPTNSKKPIIPKKRKKGEYGSFGIGIGITLPQVFQANLTGVQDGQETPRWDVTIDPIYNFGVNFGVTKELMIGLNFATSKAKIVTDLVDIGSNCYGGRFQIGMYRHTVNPFVSITALYGSKDKMSYAIKQVGVGIDFLKGRFKIGCEIDCLWFSSNYHVGDVQFNNDGIFSINGFKDTRFNAGINMKVYF
jgi:hypothetical protein